jgi:hypothetical protein
MPRYEVTYWEYIPEGGEKHTTLRCGNYHVTDGVLKLFRSRATIVGPFLVLSPQSWLSVADMEESDGKAL